MQKTTIKIQILHDDSVDVSDHHKIKWDLIPPPATLKKITSGIEGVYEVSSNVDTTEI